MKDRHGWFQVLLISEGCAFLFAIVFVVVATLTLPRTDGAYGQAPFEEPLVLPIMSVVAASCGLVVWPFMWLVLGDRRLTYCLPIVTGVTLAWIIITTPISIKAGFLGSFLALFAALLACLLFIPRLTVPGHCVDCGYDLTGNVSGVCPECGAPVRGEKAERGTE